MSALIFRALCRLGLGLRLSDALRGFAPALVGAAAAALAAWPLRDALRQAELGPWSLLIACGALMALVFYPLALSGNARLEAAEE